MSKLRVAAVVCTLPLIACAGGTPDGVGDSDTLTFQTADDALVWLAAKAPDHPGSKVVYAADGSVQTIRFDDKAARDALLEEFKSYRAIRVAGHDYDIDGSPFLPGGDEELRQSALASSTTACSGGLCIAASSTNVHHTLFGLGYHEVGAATVITSGSTKSVKCPVSTAWQPGGTGNCFLFPGYSLVNDPEYSGLCGGSALYPKPVCEKISGTQRAGMNITYFTNKSGTPTPIFMETVSLENRDFVSKTYTAIGKFTLPCGIGSPPECVVDGVCTGHSASTPTAFVSASTAAGSTTCL